jgi:dTDP-4-amino-4,6-dideoxygalactose transaminase
MADKLALLGGTPLRTKEFPARNQFGEEARRAALSVFDHYSSRGQDLGSQGHFEKSYTSEFVHYQGGEGFCDAVCSGTSGLYVALGALELPKGSKVLISPIADSGCLSAIILNHLVPKLMDTKAGHYVVSLENIKSRIDSQVSCVFLIHSAGIAIRDMEAIAEFCKARGIALLEDGSQCHGGQVGNRRVGTYGDVSVFSTMNTKTHSSGGCGGLVFSKSQEIYNRVRMLADRGKPFHETDFDPKNANQLKVPALNLSQDEISCAIGLVGLRNLESVRLKRIELIQYLNVVLSRQSKSCRGLPVQPGDSPFFWPIEFKENQVGCSKSAFTAALMAEGIPINPHYSYLASDWPWLRPYLTDEFVPENAATMIARSFNLLFNEKFNFCDMDDIATAINKIERHYS